MSPLQAKGKPMMKLSISNVSLPQKQNVSDGARFIDEVVMTSSDKFIVNKREFLQKNNEGRK